MGTQVQTIDVCAMFWYSCNNCDHIVMINGSGYLNVLLLLSQALRKLPGVGIKWTGTNPGLLSTIGGMKSNCFSSCHAIC